MNLTLDFQGQISNTPYVVRPTVSLTFDLPWPWTWIIKVKFPKSYISATEGPLDIERKGYESGTMLDPLCQLELWPQLWLDNEYLDFHGKFWMNELVESMPRLIGYKRDINRRTLPMTWTIVCWGIYVHQQVTKGQFDTTKYHSGSIPLIKHFVIHWC